LLTADLFTSEIDPLPVTQQTVVKALKKYYSRIGKKNLIINHTTTNYLDLMSLFYSGKFVTE